MWKFETMWIYVEGSNSTNTIPSYSGMITPGSREMAYTWNVNTTLFLFGGYLFDGTFANDLWKFDGINWNWIGGSNVSNQNGFYGMQGVSSPSNTPGGRRAGVIWRYTNNQILLFGGFGLGSIANTEDEMNDIWVYEEGKWTWISGEMECCTYGMYGIFGVSSTTYSPGSRYGSASWKDSENTLWLFGGFGFGNVSQGLLNDLWKLQINETSGLITTSEYPATTGEATTSESTTAEATTSILITSNEITSNYITSRDATTSFLTSREITSNALTSSPVTTGELTSALLTTQTLTSNGLSTSLVTSSDLTTSILTTSIHTSSAPAVTTSESSELIRRVTGATPIIIGGVIASLLLAVAVFFVVVYSVRRYRRSREDSDSDFAFASVTEEK